MKSKGCKNKTEDGVKQYSERFWTVGHLYLKKWKKYEARLMRAEEKNKEMESIRTNMNRIVSGYEYPYHQMCLDPRLHPRKGGHLEYTPNEDRFLAVWVTKNGLGRPEDLRRAVRSSSLFAFASIFLIRTGEELERRALKVMRSTIKEHARLEALKDEQRVSATAAAAGMAIPLARLRGPRAWFVPPPPGCLPVPLSLSPLSLSPVCNPPSCSVARLIPL